VPGDKIGGIHIANSELGRHYSSAAFVLNDHAPDMAADGFASNRVFDVLASGVPLVSDAVPDLPADLASAVYQFDSFDTFVVACDRALGEAAGQRQARLKIAEIVRREHSFDARAQVIEAKILEILQDRAGG
jgi:spore maturation protein CgeB